MKLSKDIQAALMADAAQYSQPYAALAASIARDVAKAGAAKQSLWASFKDALSIAANSGHTVTALRIGLEVACSEAEVPAGSFRSYLGTVANMHGAIVAEQLTLADAREMSVADAREKYADKKPKTDLQLAKERLHNAMKDWTAAQIVALAEVAEDANETAAEAAAPAEPEEQQEAKAA